MLAQTRKVIYPTLVSLAALLVVAGCHKKQSPPPPPPPITSTAAPTADITATPSSVSPGDSVTLVWHTKNANDISIEGLGAVASAGTQTVHPTESTNYHLIARGDGGTTDATARVTVGAPAGPVAPPSNMNEGDVDDATFHQNVQDIFFDYDSYDISGDASAIINKDASYLSAHPKLKIVLGGYCDDRGSTEYNLALGENRANAAKQALASAGISPDRIRTVSYGKEKQFCTEQDESCYQQNRRAQFAVDR